MLKLIKIAVTGGVASGKSSVCRFFENLGAYVVIADAIVHELLKSDTNLSQQIVRQFGHEVIQNGQISRKILADKAFQDPIQLKKLEELIHPAVLKEIERLYTVACNLGKFTSFVVEIPLLFEIGVASFFDVTVTVLADESEAKERFHRAGFQKTEYDLRMKRHLSPEQKASKSHFTLQNKGSLESLQEEVIKLNRRIQNQ
jgi:dephospho-CoA kinase